MQRINILEFLQPQSSTHASPRDPRPFTGASYNYVLGFAVTNLLADLFARLPSVLDRRVKLRRADRLSENTARSTQDHSGILDGSVRNVHYDARSESVEISMSNGAIARIPCRSIPALDRAIRKRLECTRLSPSRTTVVFDQLDVECDIEELLRHVFGFAEERLRGRT